MRSCHPPGSSSSDINGAEGRAERGQGTVPNTDWAAASGCLPVKRREGDMVRLRSEDTAS